MDIRMNYTRLVSKPVNHCAPSPSTAATSPYLSWPPPPAPNATPPQLDLHAGQRRWQTGELAGRQAGRLVLKPTK